MNRFLSNSISVKRCLLLAAFCSSYQLVFSGDQLIAQSSDLPSATVNRTEGRLEGKLLTLDDLFPANRVLDVQITVEEEDWNTIRKQSRNFFDALQEKRKYGPIKGPYTYVNASVTIDGHEFPNVGLRKKGFIGSQSSSRPSLKIKLNHHELNASIEGLTNLTLNNNKQDPTLVSQFMGYALFNAADSPAPRCAFARVTVNGKSLGVYSHVESVRRPLLSRAFGNDQGTLYEGTVVDFHKGWENSFEWKFGDDAAGREKIHKLTEILSEEEVSAQAINEIVDLDSFYRFWAVEGLLGFWDGYSGNRNNYHLYLNPDTDKFHFMPWGADSVFTKYGKLGNDRDAPISVKTVGIVAQKLYQNESVRQRYAETLKKILSEHWDEAALDAETQRIEAMLKPHLGSTQSDFGTELEKVRKFIEVRRADLLKEISEGMPIWTRASEPPPVIPAAMVRSNNADSIWNAAKTGNIDGIKSQLDKGTNIDAKDFTQSTPLSIAALAGQVEATEFLIDNGANINAKSNDSRTPLHGAAFLGRLEIVQLFLDKGAEVNARNNRGETPLDNAAAPWNRELEGFVEIIAGMMQMEIDIEKVKSGREEVVELLRQNGGKAGEDLPKQIGSTIWEAAKLGNLELLEQYLAKEDADPNAHDDKGITPLSWAAMTGQIDAIELLLKKGADVNAANRDGGTALHAAAFLGHLDVVKLLISSNANANVTNNRGQTPLATVDSEWNEGTKQIIRFIARFLQVKVDMELIEKTRPEIIELLRQLGEQDDTQGE